MYNSHCKFFFFFAYDLSPNFNLSYIAGFIFKKEGKEESIFLSLSLEQCKSCQKFLLPENCKEFL